MRVLLLAAATVLASCAAGPDDAGDDGPDDPPDDPVNPPPPTPGEVMDQALAVWMDCMLFDDFQAANMAAWSVLPSTPGGACQSCHANGAGGFIANPDAYTSFSVIQSLRPFTLMLFTPELSYDVSMDVYQARIVVNEPLLAAVASGAPPHEEHPRFDAVSGPGMTALRLFHALTAQGLASGRCETAE